MSAGTVSGSRRKDTRLSDRETNYGRGPRVHTAKHSHPSGTVRNNRNTDIDATMMSNVHPSIPRCSEQITSQMRGRLPMTNRLTGLVLDEQQFLSKEELKEKIEEGLEKLKPRELEFANGILTGSTAAQAYLDAGYKTSGPSEKAKRERARLDAATLRKRDDVAAYISAMLRYNHTVAMEEAGFTHVEWLSKQRDLLEMALGQRKIKKVFIKEGDPVEHDVQDVCLGVAARTLETIAKHYGWLNEKLQVEGAGLNTVILRDLTGAKAHKDDETGQDEDWDR